MTSSINQLLSNNLSCAINSFCPSCNNQGLFVFYAVKNVPRYMCSLPSTRQEAQECLLGDIELGICPSCGFISNILFDSKLIDYSLDYEDQQSFSPTFNAFAQKIAGHLIERYELHQKNILEIGCGKGDFLKLICELGGNRGMGIDPSVNRSSNIEDGRVKLIRDYYSEIYADYPSDFICCRHTLEHIHPVSEFLQVIRRSINNRLNTIIFLEVPDITRILREGAFWDIFYEHCSYFTPLSLANLFRTTGFEVIDIYREYGDQYLMVEAKVHSNSSSSLPIEDAIEQTIQDVMIFVSKIQPKLEYWQTFFEKCRAERKKVVVWASGSKCISFLTTLHIQEDVQYVVDINPYRQGKFVPGVGAEIVAPEFLKEYQPDEVVLMNPIYRDEVQASLENMHVQAVLRCLT